MTTIVEKPCLFWYRLLGTNDYVSYFLKKINRQNDDVSQVATEFSNGEIDLLKKIVARCFARFVASFC
jgi:hypothetical protein